MVITTLNIKCKHEMTCIQKIQSDLKVFKLNSLLPQVLVISRKSKIKRFLPDNCTDRDIQSVSSNSDIASSTEPALAKEDFLLFEKLAGGMK